MFAKCTKRTRVRHRLSSFGMLLVPSVLLLLSPRSDLVGQDAITIYWETEYWDAPPWNNWDGNALNLVDKSKNALSAGPTTGQKDGDVIQLGYFGDASTFAPTATKNNPFLGTFLALTEETTIGDSDAGSGMPDGEFYFTSDFSDLGGPAGANARHFTGKAGAYTEAVDDLQAKLTALDTARASFASPADGEAAGYLAIRFFDVDNGIGQNGGGLSAITSDETTTMYNTVTDVSGTDGSSDRWLWEVMNQTGQLTHLSLYDDTAATEIIRTDLLWEFDNSVYNGDADVDANDILPTPAASTFEPGATTITYIAADAALVEADFTNNVDIVVSNLDLTSGTPSIDAGARTLSMIINTADGHTSDVSAGSLAGDNLGLIKVGDGEQKLSIATATKGTIIVKEGQLTLNNGAGSIFSGGVTGDPSDYANSYVDIKSGATLQLNGPVGTGDPDNDTYEWVRYLTGAAGSTLEFEGTGNHNIQIGLISTDDVDGGTAGVQNPDFAGTIQTNNTNYIKVENTGSSGNSWEGHQVISGSFAGAGAVHKEGDGRLELSGDNSGHTGQFYLDDGTLILNGANALNGNGVIVDKGKVAIGTSGSNDTLDTSGAGGKTLIGGTGTYTGNITIDDNTDGVGVFYGLDPGIGPSVSLSSRNSPWQVAQGLNAAGTGYDNIGAFTVNGDFTWNPGGVYGWEVSDFTGTAGSDWDLFSFNSSNPLAFDSGQAGNYKIKIFGINPTDGTADGPDNFPRTLGGVPSQFKFLDSTGSGGFSYGGSTLSADYTFDGDFFDIDSDQFEWLVQDWQGMWQVKYQHSDTALYLVYSVVPEPSTYVMVVGALFLPVWNFFRRRRSRDKEEE